MVVQLVQLQQQVEALSKNRRRKSSVAPTKKAHGVHMVLTLKATEEGVGSWKAAGWLSMSLLIIFLQCVVLSVVMTVSSPLGAMGTTTARAGSGVRQYLSSTSSVREGAKTASHPLNHGWESETTSSGRKLRRTAC